MFVHHDGLNVAHKRNRNIDNVQRILEVSNRSKFTSNASATMNWEKTVNFAFGIHNTRMQQSVLCMFSLFLKYKNANWNKEKIKPTKVQNKKS